jgi:YD repeat-containing protein
MLYDAVGNLISHTNFNGDTTAFAYDSMNRMILKALPGGETIVRTYTPTGKMETITDSRGVTEYTYDVRDRVTRINHPDGSFLAYTYDAAGNRTSVHTPAGTTTYTYNAANLLTTVTDPDGGVTTHTYNTPTAQRPIIPMTAGIARFRLPIPAPAAVRSWPNMTTYLIRQESGQE